jgi:hypothetical protein
LTWLRGPLTGNLRAHVVSSMLLNPCSFGPPMSTASSQTPATVSLADEEAVRSILVDTVRTLGHGQYVHRGTSVIV